MKRFKAFVIDIDGTICDYNGLLNLEAVHSIRWLRKIGYEVVLASGRGPWDAYYLGVFIGTTNATVCENGGVLMTSPSDFKLFADKRESLEAYDLLSKSLPDVKIKPVSARLTEIVLLRTFDPAEGQKILDRAFIPVTINDSQFSLHLTKKGVTKALALKEGFKILNIKPEEAVAIGDSLTDISMLDYCGYGIAVGNASEEVKSHSDYVCKEQIGDGVVEAINHITQGEIRR